MRMRGIVYYLALGKVVLCMCAEAYELSLPPPRSQASGHNVAKICECICNVTVGLDAMMSIGVCKRCAVQCSTM